MKTGMLFVATLTIALTAIWAAGCSNENTVSSNSAEPPQILSVSPQDGAADVPTSSTVTIKFDTPMDTESVTANAYLCGGDEMHEWMDSFMHHQGPGGHMMDMDQMMEWMHRIETPGEYHWNDEHDVCEFTPAGGLRPDTDYMLFIGDGMMSHSGVSMSAHHDGYMYHFHTAP